jgi:hypothetical protein
MIPINIFRNIFAPLVSKPWMRSWIVATCKLNLHLNSVISEPARNKAKGTPKMSFVSPEGDGVRILALGL